MAKGTIGERVYRRLLRLFRAISPTTTQTR